MHPKQLELIKKHGHNSWQAYLKQVFHRLDVEFDSKALKELAKNYQQRNNYVLFPDAASAAKKIKQLNFKTAVVTTIARFISHRAICPSSNTSTLSQQDMRQDVKNLI